MGGLQAGIRLLAVAAILSVPGLPAAAQSDADRAAELGLVVEVGYGGLPVERAWNPVTVSLSPSRLFAGLIEVSTRSGATVTERREVEVAGGATKQLRFLMPPGDTPQIRVLPGSGADPITVRPQANPDHLALTGFLGAVPAGMPDLSDPASGNRALMVPVDPEMLDLGPEALDALTVLVARSTDLPSSGRARDNLLAAVSAGLDLVVTVIPGADLSGLGDAASAVTIGSGMVTVPDDQTVTVATVDAGPGGWPVTSSIVGDGGEVVLAALLTQGSGRIAIVGAEPGAGNPLGGSTELWGPLLAPGRAADAAIQRGEPQQLGSGELNLPSVAWLTLFLLIYVLVVGPVNGILLSRMRRRELAWVTVPVVTAVFSAGAFFLAGARQPPVALSGATMTWADGHGTEQVALLVRSPRQGSHVVELPGHYNVVSDSFATTAVVRRGGDTTAVSMDLDVLQVGSLVASRAIDSPPPLRIEATVEGGRMAVGITNVSTSRIERVTLISTTDEFGAGDLNPGDSAEFELALDGGRMWGMSLVDRLQNSGHSWDSPLVQLASLSNASSVLSPTLWVVGYADGLLDRTLPRAEGRGTDDQGTALLVGVTPEVSAGDVPGWAATGQVIGNGVLFGGGFFEGRSADLGLRFRLPAAALGADTLVISSPELGLETECRKVEQRDEDGNLLGVVEECEVIPLRGIGRGFPGNPGLPFECPPDAVSCTIDDTFIEICWPNGVCEGSEFAQPAPGITEPIPQPDLWREGFSLQVLDWRSGQWLPVEEAVQVGRAPSMISPHGEVWLRSGGFFEVGGIRVGTRSAT